MLHWFSVQFSRSVVSNSMQPHGLQHTRLSCPSPSAGAYSNSCSSSQWCHPTISSSVIPFSSCPQSLPASESFPMSQLFAWGGQSTGHLASFLDSILKSRDITLPTNVHLVKAMVFPVVMHGCESWTVKKAERWRIDAFELWCWRRLLRVPWPARKSNQSILKEISPGCSLERLMLKLKLQYFGYLMRRADSFEKTLMLGKIECRRRRGRQDEMVGWHHWLDGHEFE